MQPWVCASLPRTREMARCCGTDVGSISKRERLFGHERPSGAMAIDITVTEAAGHMRHEWWSLVVDTFQQ